MCGKNDSRVPALKLLDLFIPLVFASSDRSDHFTHYIHTRFLRQNALQPLEYTHFNFWSDPSLIPRWWIFDSPKKNYIHLNFCTIFRCCFRWWYFDHASKYEKTQREIYSSLKRPSGFSSFGKWYILFFFLPHPDVMQVFDTVVLKDSRAGDIWKIHLMW